MCYLGFLAWETSFQFLCDWFDCSIGEKGYDIKNRKKIIDRKDHLIKYTKIASLPLYPDKADIDGSTMEPWQGEGTCLAFKKDEVDD